MSLPVMSFAAVPVAAVATTAPQRNIAGDEAGHVFLGIAASSRSRLSSVGGRRRAQTVLTLSILSGFVIRDIL